MRSATLGLLAGFVSLAPGQGTRPAPDALLKVPVVQRALDAIKAGENQTIDDQVRFCETPAPPFQESARAQVLRREFVQLGLQNVRIDRAGNVLADRPGESPRPHLILASHLDTVFPPETRVRVSRQGLSLKGPGIGDNCRGLAVLVAIARALRSANIRTGGSITFAANVGEEGLGDLRGVREILGVTAGGAARTDVDTFLSIDGPGLFVTNAAVGSRRYRVTFKGPGGHSYAAFGTASPIGALGRAVAKINDIRVPASPRSTYNVGRVGGGTSVNAIAAEAWMEIDIRSLDPVALSSLDARVAAAIESAVTEENARWGRPGVVSVSREVVGNRPAGSMPESSPLVQTALRSAAALGISVMLSEASTDANLPMSLGIPAVTIGGGGSGTDAHAVTESFEGAESWKGSQYALLLTIALSQR